MNRISCILILILSFACSDESSVSDRKDAATPVGDAGPMDAGRLTYPGEPVERPSAPSHEGPDTLSKGCYVIDMTWPSDTNTRWLVFDGEAGTYSFNGRTESSGVALFFQPADLATYLLYDSSGRYVVWEDEQFVSSEVLTSAYFEGLSEFQSPAEWAFETSVHDALRFQIRHVATGAYLSPQGLQTEVESAGVVAVYPAEGCREHPELSVDAVGAVLKTHHDDGDLFGIVDSHSHIFANYGFGPGVHGAPFHRLGVAHALPDCELAHGPDGKRDLWGYFADGGDADVVELFGSLAAGQTSEFNHGTDGYPSFSDWPSGPFRATHQTQYYRWLERAWLGGLRLVVQHAVANQVICDLQVSIHPHKEQYQCNDMVSVEQSILETYAMERYIDAQAGGEGKGFFRVVTSPEEARAVIGAGKMAVVLGIETSNLFDCYSSERPDRPSCDAEHVSTQLARFHELGVRVLFPVHKYDNGFSAGDGHRGVIEIANFINGGHYSSFVQDCDLEAPGRFDQGRVLVGGLNQPREVYGGPAAVDMTNFANDPIASLSPYIGLALEGPLDGDWCQSHGLTELGGYLVEEMMRLGMIIEMDHFPRRSYERVYQMLVDNDYPAIGTHGDNFEGRIYALGGMSKTNFRRCHDSNDERNPASGFVARAELRAEKGEYPAEGFGFDLNGFAGAPGPRFGPKANCSEPQENPVTYPFDSVAGDVQFTQPLLGERTLDFNTEGMVHIGLVPELIEDAKIGGASDADLDPLFRSAEAYIRMWEKAERRSSEMQSE